jgi:hypothetical protein
MIQLESDAMTTTTEPLVSDPRGLLTSGEELAPSGQLALALGCSRKALESLLGGPLYRLVRFVRQKPGPTLYSVSDVRTAFEPYRAGIEARKAQADAMQASQLAAKRAKGAARLAAPSTPAPKAKIKLAKENPPPNPPKSRPPARSKYPVPEVIVLARRPSVRP